MNDNCKRKIGKEKKNMNWDEAIDSVIYGFTVLHPVHATCFSLVGVWLWLSPTIYISKGYVGSLTKSRSGFIIKKSVERAGAEYSTSSISGFMDNDKHLW